MASEDLLKNALAAFNALSPEQQAEMLEEQRQSWVRGNVGLSRDEAAEWHEAEAERKRSVAIKSKRLEAQIATHEASAAHFRSLATRPAPAATDTGLVTVGYLTGSSFAPLKERGSTLLLRDSPNEWPEKYKGSHALVTRSQAEELLAAERAKTERWHKKAMDAGVIVHSDGTTSHPMRKERDDLKADNARKDAQLERFRCDRAYTVGFTDGYAAAEANLAAAIPPSGEGA